MRFNVVTLVLASLAAVSVANGEGGLVGREFNDIVLDAREVLEDLGFHARALQGAALSTRRLDHLEARMAELEEELAARGTTFTCAKCGASFKDSYGLTQHKDQKGHWQKIAPKGGK